MSMGQATTFATFETEPTPPYTIEQAKAMKSYKHKTSLTLVEMLIAVAIIAILAIMVIGIAARINSQGKEQLTENTFALLDAALGQFQDYGYNYRHEDYDGFEFPLDCNGFDDSELVNELEKALDLVGKISIRGGTHDPNYSGSEALYFFLSRVPESRKTLDKIDSSLITDEDSDGDSMKIKINGKDYPLLRIIDPWGTTLQYSYYRNEYEPPTSNEPDMDERRNFPVITSAGPDRNFGTADDIASR